MQTSTHFIGFPTHTLPNLTMTQISTGLPKFVVLSSLSLYLLTIFQHPLHLLKAKLKVKLICFQDAFPSAFSGFWQQAAHCCYYLGRHSAERAAAFKNLLSSVVSQGCTLSYLPRMHTKIFQYLSQRENWLCCLFSFLFWFLFFFSFSEVITVNSLKWFGNLRSWSPEDISPDSWYKDDTYSCGLLATSGTAHKIAMRAWKSSDRWMGLMHKTIDSVDAKLVFLKVRSCIVQPCVHQLCQCHLWCLIGLDF